MEKSSQSNRRPFAEDLSQSSYERNGKLFELKEHPNVVVRLNSIDVSSEEKLAGEVARLKENRGLFASLEQDGVRVAKFDYVIGNKGQGGFAESYALVEKINGKNLVEMESFDARAVVEIDECYAGYMMHLLHVLKKNGRYWSDIQPGQIVYGTRDGDVVPHAYVVDIDPVARSFTNMDGSKNDHNKMESEIFFFASNLQTVYGYVSTLEGKAGNKSSFEATRA